VKIEDGKGMPLGRSYGVKLWPTLVFLRDGRVIQQMARPAVDDVRNGVEAIA
jgi:thioredoxin 1